MKTNSKFLVVVLALFSTSGVAAQGVTYDEGNEFILAETKQVNQFFRRFNGEEDYEGKRFSTNDPRYQQADMRRMYISNLFDNLDAGMVDSLKGSFIYTVTREKDPKFLNHRRNDWYAQLDVIIKYEKKERPCTLFLKMERENMGTKWVLANVYFKPFITLFKGVDFFGGAAQASVDESSPYLHPKSHEINFINLKKAFTRLDEIEKYAANEYNPDFLTLFIYELKRGNAEFLEVKNLKFHFFQIDNWYFEVSKVNRKSTNSGWLITELMRVAEKDKEILRKYIFFHENNHLPYSP
ncbi:hypothetical protein C900_05588 [Fulvivirga imtechensis AK7]|uniref:Uncharacterized protein n=1 Tax=Fulvivirga imtechensis AK7 TaxID=1237149 RepID=L8JJB9_9BACT|nr:hypothetical protein [Fulvivirga imtechensis]ELR68895.1 hypothetical protein C900_05588 [Fulvivirga imtechensis AK7]